MDTFGPVDPEIFPTSGYDAINGPTVMTFLYNLKYLNMSHRSKYEQIRSSSFGVIGFFVLVSPKKEFPTIH